MSSREVVGGVRGSDEFESKVKVRKRSDQESEHKIEKIQVRLGQVDGGRESAGDCDGAGGRVE